MRISNYIRTAAAAFALALASTAVSAQTITLWTFLDPNKTTGRDIALKQVIEKFEAANPGVKVKVEPQIFSELGVKFLLGHRTGQAPDVTFVNTENIGALIRGNSVADLNAAFINKWPADADKDFYMRAGWDAAKVGNARYAVPLLTGTTTLFYRKDLFRAAGIEPSSIKTWDDLTSVAKKLTRDTNGDGNPDVWGMIVPLSPERTGGLTIMASMIREKQETIWEGERCKPVYDTEIGRQALQVHADWITVHKIMPREALVTNSDDAMEQFVAGKFAMAMGPFARYAATAKSATWGGEANLGVLPWPTWDGKSTGPQMVTGWNLAAWRNSKNLPTAAKFIDYMIGEEAGRIWASTGGQVPIRTSVFADKVFDEPQNDYMRQMQKAWTTWSLVLPTHCNLGRFDADLNSAVQRIVLGQATPSQALQEAEKKFTARQ